MAASAKHFVPIIAAACLLGSAMAPSAGWAAGNQLAPARVDGSKVNPQPLYPADAQRRGEQGSVDIAVYVNSSGQMRGRLKILKSSGFQDLDNSAINAVLGWHYIPAVDAGGDTTSSWLPLHIVFTLPKPPAPKTPAKPAKHDQS